MKILKQPVFLLCLAIASVVYLSNIFTIELPNWIRFYVNDALCMPLVLTFCLLGIRGIKGDFNLYLPLGPIIILTLFYAILFEWLLPQSNSRYTADWIDVLLYSLGSLGFYWFQKKLY
ncbi:hypothetical protein [Formosa sp. PL04]|uniref:hypothetical protein n=1 Tax=Formosa sp. PL04 TaxID=3081755 RepID=UPI0029825829|nr:hypothetical protein [Formosa sp. PL04]MDW5290855.1 hypothetical protein [Formosa sp. PL04]